MSLEQQQEDRDELCRDVSALLNALPNGAHDVTEGVVSIRAMRESIMEAHEAIDVAQQYISGLPYFGNREESETSEKIKAALAKLKPFLP